MCIAAGYAQSSALSGESRFLTALRSSKGCGVDGESAPVMIPAGGRCRPVDAEGREIKLGIVPTKEESDAYFRRDR